MVFLITPELTDLVSLYNAPAVLVAVPVFNITSAGIGSLITMRVLRTLLAGILGLCSGNTGGITDGGSLLTLHTLPGSTVFGP